MLRPNSVQLLLQLTHKQDLTTLTTHASFGALLISRDPHHQPFECSTALPRSEQVQQDISHFGELLDELKTYQLREVPSHYYMHAGDRFEPPNDRPFSDVSFSGILYSRSWNPEPSARLYFKIDKPVKSPQPTTNSAMAKVKIALDIVLWRYIVLQRHGNFLSSISFLIITYNFPCEGRLGLLAFSWTLPVASLLFVARDA